MASTDTFTWGDNSFFQSPGWIAGQWSHIAAGPETSLFIRNGKLWAIGPNTGHWLSEEQDSLLTLTRVDFTELEVFHLQAVSSGREHIVAIDDRGLAISWGAHNEFGQVGHGELGQLKPVMPRVLSLPTFGQRIKQVSCGEYHTLLLAETGQVWSFGSNMYGQLGLGNFDAVGTPTLVGDSLACMPVRQVAAGMHHSVCLVISGTAYSWGKNHVGQLGIGEEVKMIKLPRKVHNNSLDDPLRFVAVGGAHSAFLHFSGCVTLSGDNRFGQLGCDISVLQRSFAPLALQNDAPLNGMPVRHVLLGECHTILLVESKSGGAVMFGFGLNSEQQLGRGEESWSVPREVVFENITDRQPVGISVGYRHNIAILKQRTDMNDTVIDAVQDVDERVKRPKVDSPVPVLLASDFALPCPSHKCQAKSSEGITIAISPDANVVQKIPQSGVSDTVQFWTLTSHELKNVNMDDEMSSDTSIPRKTAREKRAILENILSSPEMLNASFCFPDTHTLRFDVDDFLLNSAGLDDKHILDAILLGIDRMEANIFFLTQPDHLRCLLIYLLFPVWRKSNFASSSKASEVFQRIVMLVALLPPDGRASFVQVIRDHCSAVGAQERLIPHVVGMADTFIEVALEKRKLVRPLWESVLLCDIVWCGCRQWVSNKTVTKSAFAIEAIMEISPHLELTLFYSHAGKQKLDVDGFVLEPWDYECAVNPEESGVALKAKSFLAHPHLVPIAFKQKVLQVENETTHRYLIQSNLMSSLDPQQLFQLQLGHQVNAAQVNDRDLYFVVEIRRDHLLEDTMIALANASPSVMRRPLRVRFEGEDGKDEGGVTREFFKLLMQRIFDPDFGMFKEDEESGALWFNPAAEMLGVPRENFLLVGTLVGLAVYNNLPGVDVPFPRALFKKLKNEEYATEDLAELSPAYAISIERVLTWTPPLGCDANEEFENTFCLDFTVTHNAAGTSMVVPLGPDGGPDKAVNMDNREEFCRLLRSYILDESVKKMFEPFHEGFLRVCSSAVLDILAWDDVQKIVRAEEDLDFNHLRASAQYDGGYSEGSPYIEMFWDVVSKFERGTKRQFLAFVTGSDFAPAGGLGALKIKIQKNGIEPTRALPTAHTCFNLLLLPEYSTRAKMENLLRTAVENSEGFGLQ